MLAGENSEDDRFHDGELLEQISRTVALTSGFTNSPSATLGDKAGP